MSTLGLLAALAGLQAGHAAAASRCRLGPGGQIKHVIIMQFDNVHLTREDPNVPSDIEQIPALYRFLKDEGSLLSNDHTALISHTTDGITSTETGLYPGDEGLGVSNSFEYYVPFGSGTANDSAFTYWTDPVSSTDSNFEMIFGGPSATGTDNNTPAPWVPFTRAGCDFAGIGSANMEFENDTRDVSNVFGSSSPQSALGNWSFNTAFRKYDAGSNLGVTDFEGLAIHCSLADSQQPGGLCSPANGGEADSLPDEPGGYTGYNGLFGALGVDPALTGKPDEPLSSSFLAGATHAGIASSLPSGNWQPPAVYDVYAPNANNAGHHPAPDPGDVGATDSPPPETYQPAETPTTKILDSTLNPGFPGFDGMEANNALGYTAAAQEAGVPVTYTYLSDVHDDQYSVNQGDAYGPGEAGHEAQLREYNAAFEAFFHRLAHDGIGPRNTVFLVTVDEGDHFAGGAPLNQGCDGVHVACQYTAAGGSRNVGEVDVNLPQLLQSEGNNTRFGFNFDDAPAILVPNQTSPAGTPPGQGSSTVRGLEHTIASTSEFNPIVGKSVPITVELADETEEQILHMINADPRRDPTFTLFGDPSFFFQTSCDGGGSAGCPTQNPGFAWNHGDIQPEIAATWQGWVGPGVRDLGQTGQVWTDHTDARPTLLTLLGLRDDYRDDGRAIAQILDPWAMPWSIRDGRHAYDELSAVYKQLTAPFGEFGTESLAADSSGVESTSPGDSAYTAMDSQLQRCGSARDALAGQIQAVLEAAETGQRQVSRGEERALVGQAQGLIAQVSQLAAGSPPAGSACS